MKGMTKENIVIDTNSLEDARKSSLLDFIFNLPYTYQIPDAVFKKELSEFSEEQRMMVLKRGLKLIDLPGNLMQRHFGSRTQTLNSRFTTLWDVPWPKANRDAYS